MKYFKEFLKRGFAFAGLGPVIAGMIYLILSFTIEDFQLTGVQVFLAIISTYLLAFVQAGASVFNQIESWPLAKSLGIHLLSTYIAYVLCYLVNSWIPFEPIVVLIFTGVFLITYFIIWLTVYLIIKQTSKKINAKLN
ncbi:MAG: DUF3021 domain-containing protein [Clostridia bacterium]|nr:DUF3021 domain-containing protein [Clostridia bacterium]